MNLIYYIYTIFKMYYLLCILYNILYYCKVTFYKGYFEDMKFDSPL